jgi:hypothetical protein
MKTLTQLAAAVSFDMRGIIPAIDNGITPYIGKCVEFTVTTKDIDVPLDTRILDVQGGLLWNGKRYIQGIELTKHMAVRTYGEQRIMLMRGETCKLRVLDEAADTKLRKAYAKFLKSNKAVR